MLLQISFFLWLSNSILSYFIIKIASCLFFCVGIRLFFDEMATDDLECKALSHKKNLIDIYSNSWGPDDRGFAVAGPGPLTRDALKKGAEEVI